MHALSFQLKRAHLVTTAYAQKAVEKVSGMTPARYDVLALMREDSIRWGTPTQNNGNWLRQKTICRRLGLHHSTVSKMLKRMEEMGWIRRWRDTWADGRDNIVELTEVGFRRAHQAMSRVYRTRALLTPFEKITRQLRPLQHVTEAMTGIWDTIDGIARYFNDNSWFVYPHGLTRKPAYLMPDAKSPIAWDILRALQRRGRRTSMARYLKKIEWRHAVKCWLDHRFRPAKGAGTGGEGGEKSAASEFMASMTRGCAVGTRVKAGAKLRGVPTTCRRRFPGYAAAEMLALRELRLQCDDPFDDEGAEDDDFTEEDWAELRAGGGFTARLGPH